MRTIFIIFLVFIANHLFAQLAVNNYSRLKINDIALMEQVSHQRLQGTKKNATAASNNFDVKYYRCEWELDPAVKYIKGEITVYFTTISPTQSIIFDLMDKLTVDSILQRGKLLTNLHDNNELKINFPDPYNAGVLDSVSIYYQGIPVNTGFGSFIQSTHNGVPVMWSLSEPYGSRDWWPCKNGLDDKADSIDIIIKHPIIYKAASNGLLQSEENMGVFVKTHWKHRYPIATYLICFAITNYTVFNNAVQLGNVLLPMQTYCYPESLASFQAGTQNVLDALQLFHNKFGDYPFIKEKYGHVQFGWGGGMEHQTSTFIVSINENLIAHELAHQWFGDKITCGNWQDIWLNEGFATHLASFYMENKYPLSVMANRKAGIDFITSQLGGSVKVDDITNVNRIFDGRLSYTKGSHLLYMLRWILGDAVFFKAIQAYQNDPALQYGFATTADLKKNLEKTSGKNLTNFFTDWYEGQGYPSYKVQWSQLGSGYVRIILSQTTSHPSVTFFALPLALQFKKGDIQKTIVLDNKFSGEIFIKNIGFDPDEVVIDPEYWLITKNNTSDKLIENVADKNNVQIFPNPVGSQFYVYCRNFSANDIAVKIYNTLGQLEYNKNIDIVNGNMFVEIPTAGFATGGHILQLQTNDGFTYTKKLVK
jgi:aminopeptidase N